LKARIQACQRYRAKGESDALTRAAPAELRLSQRHILSSNEKIELTELETKLAKLLLSNLGSTVSKQTMSREIYGYSEMFVHSRGLDVLVGRLRKKLHLVTDQYRILNERKCGYRLAGVTHEH